MKRLLAKSIALSLVACQLVTMKDATAEATKKKMRLNKKSVTIQLGKSTTLKVKNKKKKAKITWKSENKKIAKVNKKGKVTGKKVGKTIITCTVKQGKKKFRFACRVIVKNTDRKNEQTMAPVSTAQANSTKTPEATQVSVLPVETPDLLPTSSPSVTATPLPEETPKAECCLSGKVTMKNGTPLKNSLIRFGKKNSMVEYYCMTDGQGFYEVELYSGEYWMNFREAGTHREIQIDAEANQTKTYDVQLDINLYEVNGIVKTKNGHLYVSETLWFKQYDEQGNYITTIYIDTDENGKFSMKIEEGNYLGEEARLEENVPMQIARDYTEEEPLEIVLGHPLYMISGEIDLPSFVYKRSTKYIELSSVEDSSDRYYIPIEEDGVSSFSVLVPAGTYYAMGRIYDEGHYPNSTYMYFGEITVNEDMNFDFLEDNLHRVTFEIPEEEIAENETVAVETAGVETEEIQYDYRSVEVNGKYATPIGTGSLYIGDTIGNLSGEVWVRDAKDNVLGIYSFDTEFDISSDHEGDYVLRDGITRRDPVIMPGDEFEYELEMREDGRHYENEYYYRFMPEESGTYRVYARYEESPEDSAVGYQSYVEIMNSKGNVCLYGNIDDDSLDVSYEYDLEAGKCYLIQINLQAAKICTNLQFSVGLEKVETQKN